MTERMDESARGLGDGPMASLARMLAAVEYEHDEDRRVFGFSTAAPPHYQRLREAAHNVVDCYRREHEHTQARPETASTTIAFREFSGECTVVFINSESAGRVSCFSARDGSFTATRDLVAQWPQAEPTRRLLAELADNLGAEDEDHAATPEGR